MKDPWTLRDTPEVRGVATLGSLLALVVEDALAPALRGERVAACEHVKWGTEPNRQYAEPVEVERSAYLCPQHPSRLVCDTGGCLERHYAEHHAFEHATARCLVCETLIAEDVRPEPVWGKVLLHRAVPLAFPDVAPLGLTNLSLQYEGVLLTTPVAWTCANHADLLDLPIRMAWPTVAP